MGLSNLFLCTPSPLGWVGDVSHDGLGSWVDVHMFYSHCLFAPFRILFRASTWAMKVRIILVPMAP